MLTSSICICISIIIILSEQPNIIVFFKYKYISDMQNIQEYTMAVFQNNYVNIIIIYSITYNVSDMTHATAITLLSRK